MSESSYSVPDEAQKVFREGILKDPLMAGRLPSELQTIAEKIKFTGTSTPSVPINWRFAECMSALKALEASMLSLLLQRKYGVSPREVTINTDHAPLFFMSCLIAQLVDDNGQPQPYDVFSSAAGTLFPSRDFHRATATPHRALATNIYKTKDGRYYHTHGSMNPDATLTALGLPLDDPEPNHDKVIANIQAAVSNFDAAELDTLMNDTCRQAGTIAYSIDEFAASEHGRANAYAGLYELHHHHHKESDDPPCWWPDHTSKPSSPRRPLAGLKVVDLTRVIAGPCITRSLAEMGASIMRVTAPHGVADMANLHHDLNWGKWNCSLDLKSEEGKETLRSLIMEADVVVDGYRPGVMERLGFGREDVYRLVEGRGRGIVHVRENCYGWSGPWKGRSGWQQISDACCGISFEYGRAMGLDEAVTPVYPNSDYCTGVAGSVGVLHALIKRAEVGGSHGVDVALNYASQWIVRSVGTYPPDVWSHLWKRHGSPVFRHYHAMLHTLPAHLRMLKEHDQDVIFNPNFFQPVKSGYLDKTFILVKPVAQFADGLVDLRYDVGTRGNGVDEARWPEDLTVEVVKV